MSNYVKWEGWNLDESQMISLACQKAIGKIKSSYFRQGLKLKDCITDNNVPLPIRIELQELRKIWNNGLNTHEYIDTKKVIKKRKSGNITEVKQIVKSMEYQHHSETFGHAYAILLQMKAFNIPMDGIFTGTFEKIFNREALAQFKSKYGKPVTKTDKNGNKYKTYPYDTTKNLTDANLNYIEAKGNEFHFWEGETDAKILFNRLRKVLSDRELKIISDRANKIPFKTIAKELNISEPYARKILERSRAKIIPIVERIKHIEIAI